MPRGTTVFDHLCKQDLSNEDFYGIGWQFAKREKRCRQTTGIQYSSLRADIAERQKDLMDWLTDAEEHLPVDERQQYGKTLAELGAHAYANSDAKVSTGLDFHNLNAFYVNKTLLPFDTYSPKDSWRLAPPFLNIYRLATDVYALAGKAAYTEVLKGYFDRSETAKPQDVTERFLVLYSALIMVSYLYMLARTDANKRNAADVYIAFTRKYACRQADFVAKL
ncbi:hypothetical protein COU19_02750 [Candidatus Kaiserbacteria bacterium CG10_big_fil_rev_8_21_14_0_10_56_12]|uniref:Uncharacterized protein n=1 Tax=Candidatus Kaiserbacteria bacterium CG10_big_fil_rev_8_21_14_0_10_56_12 TaxID=1974611 RepID=A0A2H0U9M6_9BACT|nr:MAG: hypothetical protein COU19_02750 [Candidatus Kaiserbacteria bacterium CG10_big_fil_rev_8_21_14_0_10_56_12]